MDIARALTIAVQRNVSIINVSAGQKTSTIEGGRHLEDALALCQKRRILVVGAAGNDGCACLHVPAAVPTVLAVGAMNGLGAPHDASNWGQAYSNNGIMAPGVDIEVVGPNNETARRSGTSFAAAVVTRTAAKLLTAAIDAGYPLDPIDIREILLQTVDPCVPGAGEDCNKVMAGRLNVKAAFARLHEIGATLIPAPEADQILSTDGKKSPMESTDKQPETPDVYDIVEMISDVAHGEHHPRAHPAEPNAITEQGNSNLNGATLMQITQPTAQGVSQLSVDQSACSCGGDKEEVKQSAVNQSCSAESEEASQSSVMQSACGCSGAKDPQIAYALGSLWFDFGTEARYDAIVQAMGDSIAANTPSDLFAFLSDNLEYASGITFVLMQDQIPLYAIQPGGPFALRGYEALLDGLTAALDDPGSMNRVAIPGYSTGTTRLMNGMVLPIIYPDLRGMFQWKAPELVQAAKLAANVDDMDTDPIFNFLIRVYDELRNLGMTPEERALNFAATNAFQAATAFGDALARKMELFGIDVSKSPICRPDSDCWDVKLQMFDPENDRRAGRIYRYTVDVSETLPATVGPMRAWSAPLSAL